MTTPYSTGTATVSNGSTTVTGSGTSWHTSGYRAGDTFWAAGLTVRIASIDSATQITLARAWPGSSLSGANYELSPVFDDARALTAANQLLQALGANGNLTSIGALVSGANKAPYFTGAGTAALMDVTPFARGLLDDADAAGARATLGVIIAQSATDATAGRLLETGHGGLGTPITLTASDNLNNLVGGSFYYNPSGGNCAGNNYPITSAGALINLRRTSTNTAQIFISYAGNSAASDLRQFTRSYGVNGWSPWSEQIHQGRIVGAVSQASGVPTGAVVERGSNGNGDFIRWADGTQICLGAASSASDGLGATVSLPAAFVNTGYRVALAARDNFPRFGAAFSRTTTSFRAQTYTDAGGASTTSLDYTAIGRWF